MPFATCTLLNPLGSVCENIGRLISQIAKSKLQPLHLAGAETFEYVMGNGVKFIHYDSVLVFKKNETLLTYPEISSPAS